MDIFVNGATRQDRFKYWGVKTRHTGKESRCLRCSTDFDYDDGTCPECGWSSAAFRERGRFGLGREGTGCWEE